MELEAAQETIRRLQAENRDLQERADPNLAIERLGMGCAATLCWVCQSFNKIQLFSVCGPIYRVWQNDLWA